MNFVSTKDQGEGNILKEHQTQFVEQFDFFPLSTQTRDNGLRRRKEIDRQIDTLTT